MTPFPARGLYAITAQRYPDDRRLLDEVSAALQHGVAVLQFRDKSGDAAWRRTVAGELSQLCRASGVPLIVNDDVELAAAIDAAGVHLGRDDPPLATARERLQAGSVIGVSCYASLDRASAAARAGADYLAFGSAFVSATKPQPIHCPRDTLRAARAGGRPVVARGGITPENGRAAIQAGADFLAVIGALFDAPDIGAAAQQLAGLWRIQDRYD